MFNFSAFNRLTGIVEGTCGFVSDVLVLFDCDKNKCDVCWNGKSYHHEREAMWEIMSWLNRHDPSSDGKHFDVNGCEVNILKY